MYTKQNKILTDYSNGHTECVLFTGQQHIVRITVQVDVIISRL